jgi:hypothetical protein
MSLAYKARRTGSAVRKGVPHKLTPARAAQIHRWQMLGAAAKKGRGKAQKAGHHSAITKGRNSVTGSYANATKWGITKLIAPTSLITPAIPGWQPGDKLPGSGVGRRRRR